MALAPALFETLVIPLHDPGWKTLDTPGWVLSTLREVEAGNFGDLADLCVSACDQGTLFPWSFAVVPHFVRLAREVDLSSARTELLGGVGAIAVHRIWWRHRFVPVELRVPFQRALEDARDLLGQHIHMVDVEGRRRLASLLAMVSGHPAIACPLQDAWSGVRCRSCNEPLPRSERVGPAPESRLSRSMSCEDLADWMAYVGLVELGEWLRDGDPACPACGESFLPSRPHRWFDVTNTEAVFEEAVQSGNDEWLAIFRTTVRGPPHGPDWMAPQREEVRKRLAPRVEWLVPLLSHRREAVALQTLKLLAELDARSLLGPIRSAGSDERRAIAVIEVLRQFEDVDGLRVFADRDGVVGALSVLALCDVAPDRWALLRALELVDSDLVHPLEEPQVGLRANGERFVRAGDLHWLRNRIGPRFFNQVPVRVLSDAIEDLIALVERGGVRRWAAAACLLRLGEHSRPAGRRVLEVLRADALWKAEDVEWRVRFGWPGSRMSLRKRLGP